MTARTRRGFAAVIAAAALALSGCGLGPTEPSPDRAGSCTITGPAADGTALTGEPSGRIVFQTTALKQDFSDYFEGVIAAFEEKYPDTEIVWQDDPGDASFTQRLVTDAMGCSLPDVVNLNTTTAYALYKYNFLLNLSTAAPEVGDDFLPSLWDSLLFPDDADHYVMPWYWGLLGLQTYNKELMLEAGLDPENPPTTFAEQFAAAEKIGDDAGGDYTAFVANPRTRVPSDWQMMEAEIMNEDQTEFTFGDDQRVIDWLTQFRAAFASGGLPTDTLSSDTDVTQLYSTGDLVWGSTNGSYLRYVQETNASVYEKTGAAPLVDTGGRGLVDSQLIAVPTTSKNPVTAVAFATFLLSPENQSAFVSDPRISNFPSTTESMEIPKFTEVNGTAPLDEALRVSVELAKDAESSALYPWSDSINSAVLAELQLAIAGRKSPEQALQDAQRKANTILQTED